MCVKSISLATNRCLHELHFQTLHISITAMQYFRQFLITVCVVLLLHGFVFGQSITSRTSIRTAKVHVATAKLRTKPTEGSRTLGLLDHDASLTVITTKSGWVQVKTKRGTSGWIRRDLVVLSKSVIVKTVAIKRNVKAAKHSNVARPVQKTVKEASATKTFKPASLVSKSEDVDQIHHESDGHLPEIVRASGPVTDNRIEIVDPIADKRSSVVDFAQGVANSTKSSSPVRSTLMSRANSQRGTPYRYGSSGGGTFDCSGFTSAMYRKVGVRLPRTAAEQFGVGLHIAKPSLTKGDLVFFRNTAGRRGISHVGIYSGNGMFIHASSRGHAVRIDTLSSGYYASHFAGGRRLIR